MKLLFCFLSYVSPDQRMAGGTTHFVENLKRWSNSQGEISVITTSDGARLLGRLPIRCKIVSVGFGSSFLARSGMGAALALLLRVFEIFFKLKPSIPQINTDAICTESHFLPDILAAVALRRHCPRARLFSYLHHIIPRPGSRRNHPLAPSIASWLAQAISLMLMKHYSFCVLTFPHVKSQLIDLGFFEERIACIGNGVDLDYIRKIPASQRTFDACFLGNALPRKGVFDLPQIWLHVCSSIPHAKLAIMGTGSNPEVRKLRRMFIEKKLENNVHFLGYLPEVEKFATLKASRVFLFPSYEEGWGIVIGEAMACGLPVIAYDLPAYKTTFRRGILKVPIGSVSDFAEATLTLLRDAQRRVSLGEEGRVDADEFNLDRIASRELLLMRELRPEIERSWDK